MESIVQRFLSVRREETKPLLLAAFYFFCVLTALMVLRPARDALGMERGMDSVRWLFVATAFVTLAVNPLFGWLVSKYRRITFITATYGFFAVSLVGFYGLLSFAPQSVGRTSGMIFYVWFSVFNLFCPMVFWALMVDRFTLEQSTRMFGTIAVGGTLGAIFGLWLAGTLAIPIGTPALLLVAVFFLALAILMAWGLIWIHPDRSLVEEPQTALDPTPKRASRDPHRVIGGSPWDGALEVLRSRYLLGISGYMLLFSTVATLIYFTRMQMVDALAQSTDNNTRILAQLDMVTQTATLALQLVAARQIMRRFGVSTALAILPIFMALGFVGLVAIGTLAIVVALDVALKATERAITRPARETLFTVLTDEEKYKSKAFIDTFIYRGGDALGAGVEGMVGKFALGLSGLAAIALPMTAIWTLLGWWLGQEQNRRAERSQPDTENSTNP